MRRRASLKSGSKRSRNSRATRPARSARRCAPNRSARRLLRPKSSTFCFATSSSVSRRSTTCTSTASKRTVLALRPFTRRPHRTDEHFSAPTIRRDGMLPPSAEGLAAALRFHPFSKVLKTAKPRPSSPLRRTFRDRPICSSREPSNWMRFCAKSKARFPRAGCCSRCLHPSVRSSGPPRPRRTCGPGPKCPTIVA